MIERELADLLLRVQAAHREATQTDSFWTLPTVAFHWKHLRMMVNRYSPEQQEAYKHGLLTELAEAGSAKAWVEKWLAERPPAGAQTESAPESDFPTAPTPDPASEESQSPALTQTPIDYTSRARDLLGAGKSPTSWLWDLNPHYLFHCKVGTLRLDVFDAGRTLLTQPSQPTRSSESGALYNIEREIRGSHPTTDVCADHP
jgi:hypothetical protein